VSFGAFDVVVVVDWDIHEVAAVEAEGSAFGFVRTSAHIIFVGQYITSRLPLAILLKMKKYLHLMCLVRLELEKKPSTSSRMVD
jgi:hypothetical protein